MCWCVCMQLHGSNVEDWNTDKFSIWTKKLENIEQAKTQQEVQTILASTFDPLGMITPGTLKMKLFLQELLEKEKEWDERLSSDEITTWKGIMADLNGISTVHLPRFEGNGSSQLLFLWFIEKSICNCHLPVHNKEWQNYSQFGFFLRQEMHQRRNLPSQG